MPRPGNNSAWEHQYLTVPSLPWLNEALGRGFVQGGTYLLSGEPGVGKSTLTAQAIGDLALRGDKVLYMTNEQSLGEIETMLHRLFAKDGKLPSAISDHFHIEDHVREVDELPKFMTRYVLPAGQEYHGIKAMVFDSVQGRGLSATSTQKFKVLYEFMEMAKDHGIVTILLGHINKSGQIAGPKTLEHNVDCTIYMRKAFRMRPLFVPKNRFGPAVLDPIALVMDKDGRLAKSPQANAKSSAAFGYSGSGRELAEVQAAVSLAKYGSSPKLNAPSLPKPKMRQLIKVLGDLRGVDLSELNYEVSTYVPDGRVYSQDLDLPLAVTLLSSYLQLPVPKDTVFIGELDLIRRIRPPKGAVLERLADLVIEKGRGEVKRVYLSDKAADGFAALEVRGQRVGEIVDVRGVGDLETLLRELWPAMFGD